MITNEMQAQVLMSTSNLTVEMDFFNSLGFRLINIFPDDDPQVAVMRGHGIDIRLDRNADCPPVTLQLLTDDEMQLDKGRFTAPNGSILILSPKSYQVVYPPVPHQFEVRKLRDGDPWVIGRAGMQYRDLLPGRLGGSIMASHIRIPKGGPVPDMVHYHTIGFQLIFCYKGWVKLVYEDQGPPFILSAGDCVTQPPEIRHRVLEASDNLEVIEIGVPAQHMTTIDHSMVLPTNEFHPDRKFQGQQFCHHQLNNAAWQPWRIENFEFRETGINAATNNVASVHVARLSNQRKLPKPVSHDAEILFTFIMSGQMELSADGQDRQILKVGEAYVIPPHLKYAISDGTSDLELLEVALPGNFKTI